MGQTVLMDQKDPVHRPPHAELVVLVPHPLEPGGHGGVLLKQGIFGAECVVGEGVEVDGARDGEAWVLWEAGLPRDRRRGPGPTCTC